MKSRDRSGPAAYLFSELAYSTNHAQDVKDVATLVELLA